MNSFIFYPVSKIATGTGYVALEEMRTVDPAAQFAIMMRKGSNTLASTAGRRI